MKYHYVFRLTSKLFIGLTEMNMFGLFKSHETITGDDKYKEVTISDWTEGGADAVKAIKGASIIALNPPTSLNAFLKS